MEAPVDTRATFQASKSLKPDHPLSEKWTKGRGCGGETWGEVRTVDGRERLSWYSGRFLV